MTGKAKGCSGPHTCPTPCPTSQRAVDLQAGSPMTALQSRVVGEDRPELTAGIARGLWISWVRLWSASPWMTALPQTRAWPPAKEAQNKDCHREQWMRRPGPGLREGRVCPGAGIPQGRAVSESSAASASIGHSTRTDERTLKWGQGFFASDLSEE